MNKKFKLLTIIFLILITVITTCFVLYHNCIIPYQKKLEQEKLVNEYIKGKLQLYEEENNKYNQFDVDVVFLGDSLTDGCDLSKYYPEYITLNRGIGGDTTKRLEERLEVSVFAVQPKVVVMLIGGNNLNDMFDNYETIVIKLKENLPNTKIVLVSLTAMGKDWKHKNEIAIKNNVRISEIAEKHTCYFIDVFSELYDSKTSEIYSDYTIDGAHLTDKGYVVLTNKIKETLNILLNK